MRVQTDRFGELEVGPDDVISLPDGLVGFAAVTEVVAVPVDEDGIFQWLQSVSDPSLAFLVMVPWAHFPDYEPELSATVQTRLDIEGAGDALVFCLVTIHSDPRRFSANLLGPVVINRHSRVGRQVVLEQDFPTRAEIPSPG